MLTWPAYSRKSPHALFRLQTRLQRNSAILRWRSLNCKSVRQHRKSQRLLCRLTGRHCKTKKLLRDRRSLLCGSSRQLCKPQWLLCRLAGQHCNPKKLLRDLRGQLCRLFRRHRKLLRQLRRSVSEPWSILVNYGSLFWLRRSSSADRTRNKRPAH